MKVKYRKVSKELQKMSVPHGFTFNENHSRSSVNTSIDVIEHYNIDVDRIVPYAKQARKFFDEEEIKGLAQSIKEHGVRQPISVISSKQQPNMFEVVSGERRLRASKLLGLKKIPCILLTSESDAEEIALVENVQRQELNPIEIGEAFLSIIKNQVGLTQKELSKKLGFSHKMISECMRYTDLPPSVKTYLIEKDIRNRDFLRKLLRSDDPESLVFSGNCHLGPKKKSILRIFIDETGFSMQSDSISSLSGKNKNELKKILFELSETII